MEWLPLLVNSSADIPKGTLELISKIAVVRAQHVAPLPEI
jgi:hypothetical protein